MQLQTIQKHIDTCNKPVLIFCIYGINRIPDEYFREIYSLITDDFSIITLTDLPKDNFSMPGAIYTLDSTEIQYLQSVKIFIVIDAYHQFVYPKSSFVIAFPHSFHSYNGPHFLLGLRYAIGSFDAYCGSVPRLGQDAKLLQTVHEFRLNPKNIKRSRKAFLFTGTGCPRIATIYKQMQHDKTQQDSILYAPTDYAWGNDGETKMYMVDKYGVGIVKSLLENFPEYRIAYRPCATTLAHPFTRKIIDTFQGNPRFALSQEYDHKPEFARTALLITDYSNIGETFAFSCNRPELRIFDEHQKCNPVLTWSGCFLHPDDDFVPVARGMLAKGAAFWREHIHKAYNLYTIHPEETFSNIKKLIDGVLTYKALDNTAVIQRDCTLPAWDPVEYVKKLFIKARLDAPLACAFFKDFPDSNVAAALYCYVGLRLTPTHFISVKLTERIDRFSHIQTENTVRFSDICIDDFQVLVAQERFIAAKQHNMLWVAVIDELERVVVQNWNTLQAAGI